MKTPPGTPFDTTLFVEAITDSLRARLPQIVSAEVARQLRGQAPRLADLEATALRALNARRARGIPDDLLPPSVPPLPRGTS